MTLPVLLIVPHAGRTVPFDVLVEMLEEHAFDPDARAEREAHLYRESDPHTEIIYYHPQAQHWHAPISRFVVDVNRYREDTETNGVIKLTDFQGVPLYPRGYSISEGDREARLKRFYDPFHARIERVISEGDVKLVIDGHSMSMKGPALSRDQHRERPALTLMTERSQHGASDTQAALPADIAVTFRDFLNQCFRDILKQAPEVPAEILINSPWDVDEIVDLHARPQNERPVYGFGLEINRALYLEDHGDSSIPIPGRIPALQTAFARFVGEALNYLEKEE